MTDEETKPTKTPSSKKPGAPKKQGPTKADRVKALIPELVNQENNFQSSFAKNNNVWEVRRIVTSPDPHAIDRCKRNVIEFFADRKIRIKIISTGEKIQTYPHKSYVFVIFVAA